MARVVRVFHGLACCAEEDVTSAFPPYVDRIVEEGATTDVEQIEGGWEKGDDLRFFLYAAPEDAETATFTSILDASAEELRRQGYHVSVDEL